MGMGVGSLRQKNICFRTEQKDFLSLQAAIESRRGKLWLGRENTPPSVDVAWMLGKITLNIKDKISWPNQN